MAIIAKYRLDWDVTDALWTYNWTNTWVTFTWWKTGQSWYFDWSSYFQANIWWYSWSDTFTRSFLCSFASLQAVGIPIDKYPWSWTRFVIGTIWSWWIISFDTSNIWYTYPYSVDKWQYVTFIYSGWTYHIYIEGKLIQSWSWWYSITSNSFMRFGADSLSWWNKYVGKLDDITIYDEQLSAWRVKTQYAFYNWFM